MVRRRTTAPSGLLAAVLTLLAPAALAQNAVVRSRPEFEVIASATFWNNSGGMPQTVCTISGVYR